MPNSGLRPPDLRDPAAQQRYAIPGDPKTGRASEEPQAVFGSGLTRTAAFAVRTPLTFAALTVARLRSTVPRNVVPIWAVTRKTRLAPAARRLTGARG